MYSQSKLAELADVSRNTIGRLEISYTTVSLKTILAVANALDVDIDFNFLIGCAPPGAERSMDLLIERLPQDLTEKDKRLLI